MIPVSDRNGNLSISSPEVKIGLEVVSIQRTYFNASQTIFHD